MSVIAAKELSIPRLREIASLDFVTELGKGKRNLIHDMIYVSKSVDVVATSVSSGRSALAQWYTEYLLTDTQQSILVPKNMTRNERRTINRMNRERCVVAVQAQQQKR